jgi:hypothetical protein
MTEKEITFIKGQKSNDKYIGFLMSVSIETEENKE